MLNKKIIIIVEGMNCAHCTKTVEDKLKELDNIKSVKANFQNKKVIIKYKNNIDIRLIEKQVNDLGYKFIRVENK